VDDANGDSLATEANALCEWMFGFLIDHTGDDCAFHNILERSSSRYGEFTSLDDAELDRARIFKELITSLSEILGSEEAAGTWLVDSSAFSEHGGVPPIHYLQEGGFWSLSLLSDAVTIAKAYPWDPLGLRTEVDPKAAVAIEKDLESCLDLIPAAWDVDDETFEQMLRVPVGYLESWRGHEICVTERVRHQIRRVLLFHETLRLHVRPRGYASWWRRRWAESSSIGARTPLEVWKEEGWEGLEFIKQIFWGQQH
jgi:hypothetical protein